MITQLQTPIPLITPKGKAWAVALIDYGPQWDLQWVTFIHATGECWTFRNSQIRQDQNYTWNLPKPTAIGEEKPMREKLNGNGNGNGNGYHHLSLDQLFDGGSHN